MYIKEIHLENFRGANDLAFTLDRQLNVFVGVNGSGKTTCLDASAKLLSWLANRIKTVSATGRPIAESSIKNDKSYAEISLVFSCGNEEYRWSIVKGRPGAGKLAKTSSLKDASRLAEQFHSQIAEFGENASVPVLAYYPINRAVLDIPLRIRGKHKFDLLATYEDSLTSGANFRTFFEWYRLREDIENEALRDNRHAGKNNFQEDPQLRAVRHALTELMPEFTNLTVRRQPLRMEVQKDGVALTVDQLSDGEKCLMAMVGDIARRFALANPAMVNPLEGKGVVLIDEVDLHLHPKWQSLLVPRLTKVFPNCQFLISTHSPHVINHVHPENLFLLSMEKGVLVNKYATESYGKTAERTLEDIMLLQGTRPREVEKSLEDIFDAIASGVEKTVVLEMINALQQDIGEDPDLVKAEALLRRREILGK